MPILGLPRLPNKRDPAPLEMGLNEDGRDRMLVLVNYPF